MNNAQERPDGDPHGDPHGDASGGSPVDSPTVAPVDSQADPQADSSGSSAEASAGPARSTEGRSRRRRRSRSGRREGAAGSTEGSADGAQPGEPVEGSPATDSRGPGSSKGRRAAQPLDAQAREVADAVFSEVLSGRYDEEVPVEVDPLAPSSETAGLESAQAGVEVEAGEGQTPTEAVAELDPGSSDLAFAEDVGPRSAEPHRRVLAPDPDAPKLHKVLAQSGLGSRRDLEAMIEAGRVTVNGERAHTGQRVGRGDRVQIDGKPVRIRLQQGRPRVLAYHKPVGEVVTHDDPQQRPTVFRKLPRLPQGKWQSVGRLDLNTEGLLLFTSSGELANQLMHPRFGVEREYAVRVLGRLDDEGRERLLKGVEIEGQPASFLSIDDGGGEGVNHWYRVVLNEGRNREVRRLFDAVGLTVSRLIRIRYGCVVLPRGLKRGAWVDLSERDVDQLRELTGTSRRPERGERGPRGGPEGSRRGRKGRGEGPSHAAHEAHEAGPAGAHAALQESGTPSPDASRRRGGKAPRERFEEGPIPNPLQQTFDKRALKEAQRKPRREYGDEGPIPNPLQQTFDQRALKESQRRPHRDLGEDGPIPNPLQQTYDKRALQEERRRRYDDLPADVDHEVEDEGPIPNPLQQTFDKRFAGKSTGGGGGPRPPRAGSGGKAGGPARGGKGKPPGRGGAGRAGGGAAGGGAGAGNAGKSAARQGKARGPAQPDPMRTAVGYIGADAALGKGGRAGKGRRGR